MKVNGKDDIPYMKWKIKNVPNHQSEFLWKYATPRQYHQIPNGLSWCSPLSHVFFWGVTVGNPFSDSYPSNMATSTETFLESSMTPLPCYILDGDDWKFVGQTPNISTYINIICDAGLFSNLDRTGWILSKTSAASHWILSLPPKRCISRSTTSTAMKQMNQVPIWAIVSRRPTEITGYGVADYHCYVLENCHVNDPHFLENHQPHNVN